MRPSATTADNTVRESDVSESKPIQKVVPLPLDFNALLNAEMTPRLQLRKAVSDMVADTPTPDLAARFEKLKADLDDIRDDIEYQREGDTIYQLGAFHAVYPGEAEAVTVTFDTNGTQSDHHDCLSTLAIEWTGGLHRVDVDVEASEYGGDPGRVTLSAIGNWELDGLIRALIGIGDELRSALERAKEVTSNT